jgi:hypothetical protein
MVTVGTKSRALRLLDHYANEGIFHGPEFSKTKALQHSVFTPAEYSRVRWFEFQSEYGIA